jgi:tRNA (adenine37-N6)-methyltransferase
MKENNPEMLLKPVGIVRSLVKETPAEPDWWQELVSEIVIDETLTEALDGLETGQSLIILYWLHKRNRNDVPLKINPKGRKDLPLKGLFATRTPNRPNLIGQTTVHLLSCKGNILTVKGLDALDGSPVLDIKPWNAGYDSFDGDISLHE